MHAFILLLLEGLHKFVHGSVDRSVMERHANDVIQCYFTPAAKSNQFVKWLGTRVLTRQGQGERRCMNATVQDKPLGLLSSLHGMGRSLSREPGRMWILGHMWIWSQDGLLEALLGHGPRLAQGLAHGASRPARGPCCGCTNACCMPCTVSRRP